MADALDSAVEHLNSRQKEIVRQGLKNVLETLDDESIVMEENSLRIDVSNEENITGITDVEPFPVLIRLTRELTTGEPDDPRSPFQFLTISWYMLPFRFDGDRANGQLAALSFYAGELGTVPGIKVLVDTGPGSTEGYLIAETDIMVEPENTMTAGHVEAAFTNLSDFVLRYVADAYATLEQISGHKD